MSVISKNMFKLDNQWITPNTYTDIERDTAHDIRILCDYIWNQNDIFVLQFYRKNNSTNEKISINGSEELNRIAKLEKL